MHIHSPAALLEENCEKSKKGEHDGGLIPASTKVTCQIKPNGEKQAVELPSSELKSSSSGTTIIRLVIDVGTDLKLKAVLPKFAMYIPIKDTPKKAPDGCVTLAIPERLNRVAMWIQQSFNFNYQPDRNRIDVRFHGLRTKQILQISMSSDAGGKMEIRVDSIEIAGDIIQDLCQNLSIADLAADFPAEFEEFNKVLMKDARILNETELMRQHYAKLHELNSHLIGEYIKRANNHVELLAALREVNAMIQKAARLRVGAPKSRVVAECRDAIKSNNIPSLFRIIKLGQM
eukprot:gene20538-6857_t